MVVKQITLSKKQLSVSNSNVMAAIDDVEKASFEIANSVVPNLYELQEAEREFKELNDDINESLYNEINTLLQQIEEQEQSITEYELDLTQLRKEVAQNIVVFDALPRKCMKVVGSIEV